MARFNTISIETGTTEVSASGAVSIALESDFLNTPNIYISPGSTESDVLDPGSALKPSWNANAYVTGISNDAGAWTFTINTEEILTPSGDPPVYANIKLVWRAIGPVSGS